MNTTYIPPFHAQYTQHKIKHIARSQHFIHITYEAHTLMWFRRIKTSLNRSELYLITHSLHDHYYTNVASLLHIYIYIYISFCICSMMYMLYHIWVTSYWSWLCWYKSAKTKFVYVHTKALHYMKNCVCTAPSASRWTCSSGFTSRTDMHQRDSSIEFAVGYVMCITSTYMSCIVS